MSGLSPSTPHAVNPCPCFLGCPRCTSVSVPVVLLWSGAGAPLCTYVVVHMSIPPCPHGLVRPSCPVLLCAPLNPLCLGVH